MNTKQRLSLNEAIREVVQGKQPAVELDEASQRFGGKTNIPASKEIQKHIESGKALIHNNAFSTLHKNARFVVIRNPNKGSNQDGYLMATISDPMKGRIKLFAYHGTHVSIQKAMDFAKKHKLVVMKDAKGRPLKESYLNERSLDQRIAAKMSKNPVYKKLMKAGMKSSYGNKGFKYNAKIKGKPDKLVAATVWSGINDLFVINKAIAVEVLKNGKVVTTVTRKEWEPAYKKDGGQMTPPKDRSLGWTESVELDEAMVTSTGKTISYKDGPYTGEVIKKGKIVRTETDLEFNELAKFIKDYANRGRKVNIKDNKGRTVHTESVELDEAGDPRIGKMSKKAQEILRIFF